MSKHKPRLFEGAATALITPFRDGAIDEEAVRALIEAQIAGGIAALVMSGTTGEASTLNEEEHAALMRLAVETAAGRVPIIAGCGSNNTEVMLRRAANAAAAGCDGLLLVTPYYNKATPAGMLRSFGLVADQIKLPIILYHVPPRTGLTVAPQVFAELAKRDNIVAVKEASGNVRTAQDILQACDGALDVYAGDDDLTLATIAVGGAGVISVLSGLLPAGVSMLCRLALQGDLPAAAALQRHYLPLIRALFAQVNPIPVKTALAMCGACREEFRLPLCGMSEDERAALQEVLAQYGIV